MKKFLCFVLVLLVGLVLLPNKNFAADDSFEILPTMTTESSVENRAWVGTFQLVWNDILANITKKPIEFWDYESKMAQDLNKQEFTKENLSENAYYTKYGVVCPKLKKEIERGIRKKFKEKSDILDMFDFSNQPEKIFVYAMLKKDFKFLTAFDKLPDGFFGDVRKPVKYFGIKDNSNEKLYKNVEVLFFNDYNDYAVKLFTKSNDEVLLYRTNDNSTFDKYFKDLNDKTEKYVGNRRFIKGDSLMVPDIKLFKMASFEELEGHEIKDTKFKIDKTIETIDFSMNNAGVKLKSEAAVMVRCMSLAPRTGRDFMFNDNFVLFLVEKGQKVPYFAIRVHDVDALNKLKK